MFKYTIIFLLIAGLSVSAQEKTSKKVNHSTNIKVKQKEMEINMKSGEVEALRFPAKMGTGFSWKISKIDEGLKQAFKSKTLRVKSKSKDPNEKKMSSEIQVFYIKAKQAGEFEIVFQYSQPFDTEAKPAKEITIKIKAKDKEENAKKESMEKDFEPSKKDNESAKKDSESIKKDSEPAKKDSESTKKEPESAK